MEENVKEQQDYLHKHIGGCMPGFFNFFDRPHIFSPKRLSSSPVISLSESDSWSERSSPLKSSSNQLRSPDENMKTRSPLTPSTVIIEKEFKQQQEGSSSSSSPWRFSKEAPRLSLDSRAVVDAKGSLKPKQIRSETERGSPSVIARLMGLEPLPQQPLQRSASESRVSREYRFVDTFNFQNENVSVGGDEDHTAVRSSRSQPASLARRKCFFDSGDFYPEPRQCGDLENVSKISGFDSSPIDLETLKQLLEAHRLKGLLHSSSHKRQSRNLVFDNNHISPPARSPSGIRSGSGTRAGVLSSDSPRQERYRDRSSSGKSRISPSTTVRRPTQREVSPLPWRRPEPLQTGIEEMWKVNAYNREGKTLLERCDKLLHCIAEMAAAGESGESQPSPVSVLDAQLYHEDSSPSPVMKRSLDFTAESEDESWGGSISSSSDSEYVYISDILRASDCLPQESDIFSLLEKQQYIKGKCVSRAAAQERRLIFDTVQEIMERRRRLPPWIMGDADKMQVIWPEFQKISKKRWTTDEGDLVGYVCGVLGRDLSEDGWRDCQVEMSEVVLDIERLVFKDLIGETIRHIAALNRSSLRRRLLF